MFLNDSGVEVGIQASTGVRFNYSHAGLNLRFISYYLGAIRNDKNVWNPSIFPSSK